MVLCSVACARRPTREIQEARQTLTEAEKAQAPQYARASYEEARRTLIEAQRLTAEHRYDDARIVARESATHARSAIGMTAENKKKMLDALNLNVQSTANDLADAEKEIAVAESRHVDPLQVDLFRKDLVAARARLDTARQRHDAGDLETGKKWSDDARIATDMLLREVRFAIAEHPISHPEPRKRRRARAAR